MRAWLAIVCAIQSLACGRIAFDPAATPDAANAVDAPGEPPGLIAHWRLDETMGTIARDSKGTADGMLYAGVSGTPAWTAGQQSGGLVFAGDGDQVGMGTPPVVANLAALTVTAWVRPASITSGLSVIVDKGLTNAGWAFGIADAADGNIWFHAASTSTLAYRSSIAGILEIDRWQHVAASWDGEMAGSGMVLYLDGVPVQIAITLDATEPRPDDSTIGLGLNNLGSSGYRGVIDDVRLYDRILTATEIATIYNLTK